MKPQKTGHRVELVETEILTRDGGTFCLADPVNLEDLRIAGIVKQESISILSPCSTKGSPIWIDMSWSKPFRYCARPLILKADGIETPYDVCE
jgi:hypothetical protein